MVYPSPPPSQHSIFTPVHGRNAHLFQPPKSQASVATAPTYASTSTDYFSNGASKKRSRPHSSYHEQRTHENKWNDPPPSWIASTPHDDDVFGSGQESYLVNEHYRLAGGYDTPGLIVNTDLDRIIDQDMEARRRTRDRETAFASSGDSLQGPLARERNGIPRLPDVIDPQTQSKVSWTRFAFSLVGKAFNFGTSVFKGFCAGGGQSYEFNEKQDPASVVDRYGSPPTPVPGQWQGDDFFGDFEQDNPSSPPSASLRPPNKRRQTEKDEWVLIGTPDARGASPKRKISGNHVPQATKPATARPSASRASSRRSLLPTAIRRQPSHVSQVGSPAAFTAGPDRRASVAHVRTPTSRPHSSTGHRSSLSASSEIMSPEAERYRKRQAKQDRVADKAIGNMSRQLEELIRQGQAALGTKISVEGDVDEEMVDVYSRGSRW